MNLKMYVIVLLLLSLQLPSSCFGYSNFFSEIFDDLRIGKNSFPTFSNLLNQF